MTLIEKIKSKLGMHVHTRELFLINGICFVKCVTCGMESLPWMPRQRHVKAAEEHHKDDLKKLVEINERLGI